MAISKKDTSEFWCYNHRKKWYKKEYPSVSSLNEIDEFLENLDYLLEPDIVIGDEFDFLACFEHPFKDEYLFHFTIDKFSKIMFADTLPAMFYVLEQLNYLVNAHFRTVKILNEMNEE